MAPARPAWVAVWSRLQRPPHERPVAPRRTRLDPGSPSTDGAHLAGMARRRGRSRRRTGGSAADHPHRGVHTLAVGLQRSEQLVALLGLRVTRAAGRRIPVPAVATQGGLLVRAGRRSGSRLWRQLQGPPGARRAGWPRAAVAEPPAPGGGLRAHVVAADRDNSVVLQHPRPILPIVRPALPAGV